MARSLSRSGNFAPTAVFGFGFLGNVSLFSAAPLFGRLLVPLVLHLAGLDARPEGVVGVREGTEVTAVAADQFRKPNQGEEGRTPAWDFLVFSFPPRNLFSQYARIVPESAYTCIKE